MSDGLTAAQSTARVAFARHLSVADDQKVVRDAKTLSWVTARSAYRVPGGCWGTPRAAFAGDGGHSARTEPRIAVRSVLIASFIRNSRGYTGCVLKTRPQGTLRRCKPAV